MIHTILNKYFHYYGELADSQKEEFQQRVQDFIKGRDFRPAQGQEMTSEVKIMISAVAIQITFGLEKYMFPHFNTIIVYPEHYYSQISKRYHKGEVNILGALVLSWSDLLEGLKHPDDAFNIGIHEFAHALYLENAIDNSDYLFLDEQHLEQFQSVAVEKMNLIRNNLNQLLRDYAGENIQEFFAVSSEFFFEKPIELKQQLPELYISLSKLYNQDPFSAIKV